MNKWKFVIQISTVLYFLVIRYIFGVQSSKRSHCSWVGHWLNYESCKIILCHAYRLSPSNRVSHTIFDNPIFLKWREEIKREREENQWLFASILNKWSFLLVCICKSTIKCVLELPDNRPFSEKGRNIVIRY